MATKWFYNTNEALSFVLEAGSDSELLDLSNDDDQDTTVSNIPSRIAKDLDEESNNAVVEGEEEEKESNRNLQVNYGNNNEISDENDKKENAKSFNDYVPRWQKKVPPIKTYSFLGNKVSIPPDNINTLTPL